MSTPLSTTHSFLVTVLPPRPSDGIACMLVALGNARIGVTQAQASVDNGGAYVLTCGGVGDPSLDYNRVALDVLRTPYGVALDPQVPASWSMFKLPLQIRGAPLSVTVASDRLEVVSGGSTLVHLPGGVDMRALPGQPAVACRGAHGGWSPTPSPPA